MRMPRQHDRPPPIQFEDVPLEEARRMGRGSRMDPQLYQALRTRIQALFKKGELPGRKVARRWLTTRDMVLGWLKGASEQDTLARALAYGDKQAIAAALKSGKVNIKKRHSS
jgi:hypothetical protein